MFLQTVNTLGEFSVKSVCLGRALSLGSSEIKKDLHFLNKKGKVMFYSMTQAYFLPGNVCHSRLSVKIINVRASLLFWIFCLCVF